MEVVRRHGLWIDIPWARQGSATWPPFRQMDVSATTGDGREVRDVQRMPRLAKGTSSGMDFLEGECLGRRGRLESVMESWHRSAFRFGLRCGRHGPRSGRSIWRSW